MNSKHPQLNSSYDFFPDPQSTDHGDVNTNEGNSKVDLSFGRDNPVLNMSRGNWLVPEHDS